MLFVASAILGLASCGDDNDYKATPLSTINVLSSETALLANPDTGYVVTDCEPVKAYVSPADQSWINVEIKGDSVKFYSKQNESTESRNTLLVIKKSENDSVQLNIIQRGMIFIVENKTDIVQANDNAQDYHFKVNTNYKGEIVSTPEWATANFEGSRLNINVNKNEEGHMREGYVAYRCGNYKDSVKVTQYDFEKDILGEYEIWVGYDAKSDIVKTKIPATLKSSSNGAVTLNFQALYKNRTIDVQFPVTFDNDSVSVSIASGQNVASFHDKRNNWTYFYTMFASPTGSVLPALNQNGDTLMQNTSGKITAYLKYDKKKGTTYGNFSGLAYNEGGYSAEFHSLYIGAFSSSIPYKKELIDNEWWTSLYDMVLVKKN